MTKWHNALCYIVIKDKQQEDVNVLSLEYDGTYENIVNIVCNGKVIGCINGCLEIIDLRDYEMVSNVMCE